MSNLVDCVCLTFYPELGRERGKNVLVTAFLQASLSSMTGGHLRERGTKPQMPNELCSSKPGGQCQPSPLCHPVPGEASEE